MARSTALAVRGVKGTVTTFPPLRSTVSVRWPRSRPRASMSAPIASEQRKPFRASSEMRACSAGEPRPAATKSASHLVAVEADGVRLVVEPGPADMDRRGDRHQPFLFGITVETPDSTKPPGHGGAGSAGFFEVPGIKFYVGTAGGEQLEPVTLAPTDELA